MTAPNYFFMEEPTPADLEPLSKTDLIDAMKQHVSDGNIEAAHKYFTESKARPPGIYQDLAEEDDA